MARRRVKRTSRDIIQCATVMFLEQGYTATSTKQIADELDIALGNLNYHFPTKEHLLAELVDMLCNFQWKMIEEEANDGLSSIMAICLELTAMAAICDTNAAAKDFYLSTYSSPMCLEIIRKNDTARAKEVFAQYCPDWTDEQFAEAEVLVSGIEYATLMTVGDPVSLETRIAGALNGILQIYNLPEETRRGKIRRVLAMDYRAIAERMLAELKQFVIDTNEQALEDLYKAKGLQKPISPKEETIMKKNIWKRLVSLALALVMVAGWLPHMATEAYAAAPIKLEGTTYAYEPGQGFKIWLNCACTKCRDNFNSFTNYDTHKYEITSYSYSISGGNYSISVSGNFTGCNGTAAFSRTLSGTFSCTDELYNTSPSVAIYTGSTRVGTISLKIRRNTSDHQGDATCVTADNCNLCGTSYTNTSNHEKPDEFTYSVNTSDSTKHDKEYACCGAVSETATHSDFTYSLNGNMFTKTCGICGHAATATLTADDAVYTGTPITAASITYSDGWQGEEKQPAEIADTEYINNTNAGTATVTTTVEGKELTTTFEITAKKLTSDMVTLSPTNSNYTGSVIAEPAVTVQDGTAMKESDYTVTWPNDADWTNAGTITVTVKGQNNYEGTVTKNFVIGKGTPTAELFQFELPPNAIYDGATAYSANVTSNASGLGAFTVKYNGSADAPRNAGTYKVTVDVATGDNYNAASDIELGSFTVAQADGSASVSADDVEYGDAVTPVPVSSTNGTDHVTYQYKVKDADDSTYTNEVPTLPGDYTVKATFPATTNYKMAEATADFTVSKRPITVTANDASKTYGGTDPELEWTVTSGTVLASDPLSVNISRVAGENAGDYTITVGQDEGANPNYDITFVNGTFTINKAALTVTANAVSKTYGEADPELTYKVEGLVNGDELTGQLERVAGENVGAYAVALGTLTAGDNYTITYTGADFTISKRDVTVTAKDQTITYGDAISNTEITSDGLVDGHSITVTLTPSTANVTVDGTITAGAAVITADGTDVTANYEIAYGEPSVLVIQPDTSKIDTLTTENVTSANEADIQAVREMLENADSTKEEWEAISEKCEALIEKIEEVEAQMKEATDEAAAFDAETVNSTDTEELEQLAEDIEALLDSDNLTEDERAALEEVLEQVSGMIDTIENTVEDSKAAIDTIDALDPETVTSADKDELEQAVETIDELLAEDHLTEEERKALEDAKADAEALITVIGSAQAATDTENTEKVEDVTAENVVPEDKADLEEAKADLEKALEDNGSNYTEEEKNGIQEEIDRLDAAIEALENVEAVTESITQLPEAVEPDDEETAQKILDAKKAYDALTDHEKSLVNETAKEKLGELVTALTTYDIIKGDGSTWTKDSAGTITFTANGPFSKFVGIKVDGKDVDNADYEAKSGSTIITLNQKFLKKLSTGKHTITVIYTDGEASGTFLIRAEAGTPATGDNFNILLWTSVMIVNLAAISVLLINQKKRRYVK